MKTPPRVLKAIEHLKTLNVGEKVATYPLGASVINWLVELGYLEKRMELRKQHIRKNMTFTPTTRIGDHNYYYTGKRD